MADNIDPQVLNEVKSYYHPTTDAFENGISFGLTDVFKRGVSIIGDNIVGAAKTAVYGGSLRANIAEQEKKSDERFKAMKFLRDQSSLATAAEYVGAAGSVVMIGAEAALAKGAVAAVEAGAPVAERASVTLGSNGGQFLQKAWEWGVGKVGNWWAERQALKEVSTKGLTRVQKQAVKEQLIKNGDEAAARDLRDRFLINGANPGLGASGVGAVGGAVQGNSTGALIANFLLGRHTLRTAAILAVATPFAAIEEKAAFDPYTLGKWSAGANIDSPSSIDKFWFNYNAQMGFGHYLACNDTYWRGKSDQIAENLGVNIKGEANPVYNDSRFRRMDLLKNIGLDIDRDCPIGSKPNATGIGISTGSPVTDNDRINGGGRAGAESRPTRPAETINVCGPKGSKVVAGQKFCIQ